LWLTHYSQLGLLKGASSSTATTVLTEQDLVNVAEKVWDRLLENGYQARELMRLQNSLLGGLLSKVGNQTPEFLSLDGSKIRVKYATDGVGNRIKRLEIDLT